VRAPQTPVGAAQLRLPIEYRFTMSPESDHLDINILGYEEFRTRRAEPGVVVVDVLPKATFRHGHIPGAINLPLAQTLELAGDVLPDRDQEIILYCASFT